MNDRPKATAPPRGAARPRSARPSRPVADRADPEEVERLVRYAQKAYEEAYAAAKEANSPTASLAARQAWRNALPLLTSRTAIRAYIALVAVGRQRGYIDPDAARDMMWTAQTAISALERKPQ
jgi:hypothetical protein